MAYVNGTFFCIVGVSAGDKSAVASVYGGTVVWVGPFNDGAYDWRPSGLTQQLHFKVSGINTAVKPALYNLKSGETTSIEISGLLPETDYNFIVTGIGGETKYYPFRTGKAGSGSGGTPDTATYIGPGAAGGGEVGPYPIDDNNYEGKDGTQQGIHWPSGNGYYWAKINGTGHKLYDKATDTPNAEHLTGNGYYPNAHGTGDWVSIVLEGDCWFSRCSGFKSSYSQLSTDTQVTPPYYSWGGNPQEHSGNDFKLLNNWADSFWAGFNTFAESGIDGTAAAGHGRATHTLTLPRHATQDKIVTYYCKQSLGSKFGYSIAEIKFTVPRLDPLIKVVSNNSDWGKAYFLISNGYDIETEKYTYDSTRHTERYVPIGTHIKVIAEPTSIGKFEKFTPGDLTQREFELDVSNDITYNAIFSLGQYEIKVAIGNSFITDVSKSPTHSEGFAENWYKPNAHIDISATVEARTETTAYTFKHWKIGDDIVSTNRDYSFNANRSGTYIAYGEQAALTSYIIIYNKWECTSAAITNQVSGDSGDSVQAAQGEELKLSYTENGNYTFVKWEKSKDKETWIDSSATEVAGDYHFFRPIFTPDGAECWILSKGDLNVISQPIMMKKGIIKGVNTRFIGTKDPNSLVNNEYISKSELGDFFFMLKGGE